MTPSLLALVPSLLLAAPPAPAPAVTASSWLARVNDQPITVFDLQEGFVRRHGGHKKFLAGEAETRKFLEILIDYELLMQEAYRLGLDQQPDIRRAVEEQRDREMVDWLLKTEIEDKAKPTPEAIREFWEKNTSQLFQVRQIVVESREQAEEVRAQAVAGGDFEKLAREKSIVESRLYGGQMLLGRGAMEPAWEETVYSLKPGEISPVMRTAAGWEVVRLEQVKDVEKPKLEEAKARIEGILTRRLLAERKKQLGGSLWGKYHASLTDAPRDLHALARAAKEAPDLKLATWDGGSLAVREFWPQIDMGALGSLPPFRVQEEIDDRLRAAVNAPLALLEAKARGLEAVPQVKEAAHRHQQDLMESALYQDYVLKDVKVSDADVKAYYDAHRTELVVPEKRHVAHIVAPTAEQAQELRRRLEAGEAFEELARDSTDLQTAQSGGDLGWITAKEVPPDFAPVLKLNEGEVSAPLPSKFGFHLVRVVKIQPARELTLEEARKDLQQKLLEQRQREARLVWVKQLRAAAQIRYNDRNIRAFVRQSQRDGETRPMPAGHGASGAPAPVGH
ncbi:MAG TPA: peptidyl-prolyl cis-trans isomerase [Vicinamibacteria bacterium]|nr:peptidyl-prolyl cis-trans isomerase [Vicinamibacteria bacterium]